MSGNLSVLSRNFWKSFPVLSLRNTKRQHRPKGGFEIVDLKTPMSDLYFKNGLHTDSSSSLELLFVWLNLVSSLQQPCPSYYSTSVFAWMNLVSRNKMWVDGSVEKFHYSLPWSSKRYTGRIPIWSSERYTGRIPIWSSERYTGRIPIWNTRFRLNWISCIFSEYKQVGVIYKFLSLFAKLV
jgi:hypothetical protein